MMHWGSWAGYGWGMGFGWIFMVLFWAILIALIVVAVRAAGKAGNAQAKCDDPLNILKTRYARGEITKEQFDGMLHDVKAS